STTQWMEPLPAVEPPAVDIRLLTSTKDTMTLLPHPLLALALLLAVLMIGHDLYARRVPNVLIAGTLVVAGGWQIAAVAGWIAPSIPSMMWSCLTLGLALVTMLPF